MEIFPGGNIIKKVLFASLILPSWIILIGTVQATEITDVFWDSSIGIIEITLDAFPSTWGNWTMYLDGEEMPMEGGPGNPVIRPNAPLEQPPTGLIIGTEPWVTGLADVDFPCCGTIQFDIPGESLTNEYEFNLVDFGCETASEKECPSEWIKHYGDLVIEGAETKIIENIKYFQHGNIYVNDEARLVIRNSQLMMGRGEVPTIHTYIFISEETSLEIGNSLIFPQPGSGLVCVFNHGTVSITDSPTSIHYFDMSEGAQLTMTNSEMVYTIGGLLQVTGGDTILIDSTIGALGLKVPANAHLDISGLESGAYFESWDVHEMIPEADYNLVLERTCILKDDFTGELEHGPYERGWLFFLDPDAHVRISNSELRKVFIDLINENVGFENLRVGIPSSLNYRDIELTNVVIMGQWPFTIIDSNVTIRDSDYLFLQPGGQSTVTLINSHMCEFIPRDFFGTMNFENGLWTTAGEIIGGVPHHSMKNDFIIKGSLKIDEGVRGSLQWKDARVTREYDVIVKNGNGNPIEGALIKIDGKMFISDYAGKAKFSLTFDEFNYIEPKELEVLEGENLITQKEIDFFTETPIRIDADITANFALVLTSEIGGTTDPEPGTYSYVEGTEVTITAIPETDYRFSEWTGDVPSGHENDNPITISMDSDKSITANFGAIPSEESDSGGKKGGCFIATAAYGSPLHPHLDILRDLRDTYLMPSELGCRLVNLYYKYSPFVANLISKHKVLKVVVRINLLPLDAFSYSMIHFGPIITGVMLAFIFMLPIFLISFFRRRLNRLEAKNPQALAYLD